MWISHRRHCENLNYVNFSISLCEDFGNQSSKNMTPVSSPACTLHLEYDSRFLATEQHVYTMSMDGRWLFANIEYKYEHAYWI